MSDLAGQPAAATRNIKLVVAYDGTGYHGWQRQPGSATVQAEVEAAAGRVLGHPAIVAGASRTDAGVHALGQVASLRTGNLLIPLANLRRAVNAALPADVGVLSAEEVPADFHASLSAVGKTYRYRIYRGAAKPVMQGRSVYHCQAAVDAELMASAAGRLVGRHDFRGLAASSEARASTVRTVTRCDVAAVEDEIVITVAGDGFLHKMVRNMVGTLVEIGRGHWGPERIDEILATRDRRLAGPTAPPEGLCLMAVHYPPAGDAGGV